MNATEFYRQLQPAPWMQAAACRGMGPDLFFPEQHDNVISRLAKQVCADCPVHAQCTEYGSRERFGIWGASAPKERRVNGRRPRRERSEREVA